ncbi:hypothetical protein PTSG_12240 [Salpingoeca rosetta]|uniref:Uncharacterized protein n=1 Tax=Salpingoeca rosetta (strain ATCC 50818 / BSB-021) TaxID=946362 RepID=F2U991_SALR5|nr:uncharacterized protein PTSG_12240 [Salpingoeca rosetta]EGD73294.1 hypothetical protein PTSG_12240 [Salpingoeca rosetta]|eukprot:XP_004994325.1 hypothetical protein PTSG_12240 [Salpingoeca rosetta]
MCGSGRADAMETEMEIEMEMGVDVQVPPLPPGPPPRSAVRKARKRAKRQPQHPEHNEMDHDDDNDNDTDLMDSDASPPSSQPTPPIVFADSSPEEPSLRLSQQAAAVAAFFTPRSRRRSSSSATASTAPASKPKTSAKPRLRRRSRSAKSSPITFPTHTVQLTDWSNPPLPSTRAQQRFSTAALFHASRTRLRPGMQTTQRHMSLSHMLRKGVTLTNVASAHVGQSIDTLLLRYSQGWQSGCLAACIDGVCELFQDEEEGGMQAYDHAIELGSSAVFDMAWVPREPLISFAVDRHCQLVNLHRIEYKTTFDAGNFETVSAIDANPDCKDVLGSGTKSGSIALWDRRVCGGAAVMGTHATYAKPAREWRIDTLSTVRSNSSTNTSPINSSTGSTAGQTAPRFRQQRPLTVTSRVVDNNPAAPSSSSSSASLRQRPAPSPAVHRIRFFPDGRHFATVTERSGVLLWDMRKPYRAHARQPTPVCSIEPQLRTQRGSNFMQFDIDTTGRRMMIASAALDTVVCEGFMENAFSHVVLRDSGIGYALDTHMSPDGTVVAKTTSLGLLLWQVDEPNNGYTALDATPLAFAFAPTRRKLRFAGFDWADTLMAGTITTAR